MTRRGGDAAGAVESVSELRRSLAGAVFGPDDPEYDGARICFNAFVDRRPAAIAQCIADTGIGFMFAPNHHPAMKNVAPVRK